MKYKAARGSPFLLYAKDKRVMPAAGEMTLLHMGRNCHTETTEE